MKTKIALNLLLILFYFTSCSDSNSGPGDVDTANRLLCQYWWVYQYTDYDDAKVRVQFNFNSDGTGSEMIDRLPTAGPSKRDEYPFRWKWESDAFRSIALRYEDNKDSYIDHLEIGNRRIDCYLDGLELVMLGEEKSYF